MNSMTGGFGPTGSMARGQQTGGFKEKIPSGYKAGALQQMTPEQIQLLQHLMGFVGPESFLSRLAGGDQSMFEEIETPALRQFSQMLGGLGSRFSGGSVSGNGQRGLGEKRSSGFQNTMTSAASNFAQDLAAQRMGLQRQAISDLGQMSQMLLAQRPYQRTLVPKQEKQSSGWGALGGAALGGLGGFFAGGPLGALQGAQLGYGIGSSF